MDAVSKDSRNQIFNKPINFAVAKDKLCVVREIKIQRQLFRIYVYCNVFPDGPSKDNTLQKSSKTVIRYLKYLYYA